MVKITKAARRAIRVRLAERDKNQRWLADRLGMHDSQLSDILGGRRNLSEKVAEELYVVTGVDVRERVGAA